MIDDVLFVERAAGSQRVRLDEYLDPAAEQRASTAEYEWIKQLRHLDVDGQPLRRRFTLRGDSLWWFSELYLHKQQTMLNVFRTIAALATLLAREQPRRVRIEKGGPILRTLAPQFARKTGVAFEGVAGLDTEPIRMMRLNVRARALTMSARLSRIRGAVVPRPPRRATVAAFVHRAFWRASATEGSAESYIGPVLSELEARISDHISYVGVGPSENFRARRWWHAVMKPATAEGTVVPVELFTPLSKLSDALGVWRDRHRMRRALLNSAQIRQHAVIEGYDCWPIVREELTGIALLQWPWSARAMDEAGAALDALRPEVVVTYAEAGGWGRAVMLEARRRGIPSVGLQHGFIYHSWLNYLHEDDEMRPDAANPRDCGFPAPSRTFVFDEYARSHLERCGRFSPHSLVVTGSPRLDALVRAVTQLTAQEVAAARDSTGANGSQDLVLFVAKYSQARHVLPALIEAVARMPAVQLAIKAHPAETADVYSAVIRECRAGSGDAANIRVLPATASLGPLLRASRVIVTVNSTVALDAGVLGIPALVIGLPNNLSPFVAAGIMAGAATRSDIEPVLERILYDEDFRLQIERSRGEYFKRFAIGSDGRAAARSADAVLELAGQKSSERND
jgi:hypothetical protein